MTTKDFRRIALATYDASDTPGEHLRHADALCKAFDRFTTFNPTRFRNACLTGVWDHEVGAKPKVLGHLNNEAGREAFKA